MKENEYIPSLEEVIREIFKDMPREIPLTQGYNTIVDAEDVDKE